MACFESKTDMSIYVLMGRLKEEEEGWPKCVAPAVVAHVLSLLAASLETDIQTEASSCRVAQDNGGQPCTFTSNLNGSATAGSGGGAAACQAMSSALAMYDLSLSVSHQF